MQNVIKGEYDSSNEYFKGLSDDSKDLISKILMLDYKKRLTAY